MGGNSNVKEYSIGQDYIDVVFGRGVCCRYSYRSAGIDKIEQMKMFARKGVGLNSYIMRYVSFFYAKSRTCSFIVLYWNLGECHEGIKSTATQTKK